MGLAVYNCITLDISLPMVCYRKLLSTVPRTPPVINHPADTLQAQPTSPSTSHTTASKSPSSHKVASSPQQASSSSSSLSSSSSQPIGVVPVTLSDLRSLDPVSSWGRSCSCNAFLSRGRCADVSS